MFQQFLSNPWIKTTPFFILFLWLVFYLPESTFFFPGAESIVLDSGFYGFDPSLLIRYRTIHLMILFGFLFALYWIFKILFGQKIALPTLIVLLTSSWVFLIGYWLSFDNLLGFYHGALFLTLLFYSKNKSNLLLLLILIISTGSLLIDALGTTLFLSVMFFGAVRQQKSSKIENYFWFIMLLLSIGMVIYRFFNPGIWKTFLGIQSSDYLLFYSLVLLALWPFIGFIFAAFKDAISKWKKGDIWSVWILTAAFAGLISQSPAFFIPISLMLGKHIIDFDLEQYPYRHIIQYWSTFLWVIWFFLSILFMTGGHLFQTEGGFRIGFQLGFGIWLFGLLSIVGMYGKHFNIMRIGLIGGNVWVTYSLFLILIPFFSDQFLLNKIWQSALVNKSNIVPPANQRKVDGLSYTLTSIERLDYNKKIYFSSRKKEDSKVDSIVGFSPGMRKEIWYFSDSINSGSNKIKK
jgi:hypothetical protein